MQPHPSTNFAFLQSHAEQLMRLGMLAERYYTDDPNTSLIKIRQFGELLGQQVAAQMGLYKAEGESQYDLLRRLLDENVLSHELYQLFGEIRRAGNAASHAVEGDQPTALNMLKLAWQLGVWFSVPFSNRNSKRMNLSCRLRQRRRARRSLPIWSGWQPK